jgi:putative drug exporter of the RND superfamily
MFNALARLISLRPVPVLLVWTLIMAVAIPLARLAPSQFSVKGDVLEGSESVRVIGLLSNEFGLTGQETSIIVSESVRSSSDAVFLADYERLIAKVRGLDGVDGVTRFDDVSPLKRVGIVNGKTITATLIQTGFAPLALLEKIHSQVQALATKDVKYLVTGSTAVNRDFAERSEQDVRRSEGATLPLVALVLVMAFGALVAAGLPILVGLVSITTTMAILFGVAQFLNVSSLAQSVVTLFGLGAGIDYALLMVNRFREELELGRAPREAAAITTRTAGRSVLFSGLTVAIAMGSLLVPNLEFVRSLGVAGLIVITLTVVSSLTALPALLALLGASVNIPRRFRRVMKLDQPSPFWGAWALVVMRHPWIWAGLSGGLLVALSIPAFGMRLGGTGAFGLAKHIESRRALELIRPLELGGALDTFDVVMDLGDPASNPGSNPAAGPGSGFNALARAQFRQLDASLSKLPQIRLVVSPFLLAKLPPQAPARPDARPDSDGTKTRGTRLGTGLGSAVAGTKQFISSDRRYLHLSVIPKNPVRSTEIQSWIATLNVQAKLAGFSTVYVGGLPVSALEFANAVIDAMPLAIGIVCVATFLILAVAFRSLVIPLKSILMNGLTVASSYGIITMVFQNGLFAGPLGVPTDVGVIESSLPLVIFAVTFGLSMDYEVFLLSRVQEGHLKGLDTREAVRVALQSTAGVITSAALIMIIVFAAFLQGDVVANKVIGLGLVVAIALDATVVRLVLVPAVMVLAGKWNWWLPERLKKILPHVNLEH